MGTTERLPSPRPHDPTTGEVRPSGDVTTTDGELAPDPAEDLLQRVISGRYRVEDIIGRGGMGVVYRATHLELDQEVAIKVLPSSYARDAETLKRFEREAKTASRVRHPNVVTVFDLGRLDTGEPYLVMELLAGRDLSQVMEDRGTLPLAEVVDILAPIAAAIDALHVEGVVHRDIKPSNIFFTKTKSMGEIVKLVDFGLAALHKSEGTERLTRVGHVVGTAVYMAPESARGQLSGPAGDTYALGVVAYELLTGYAPFDGQPMAVLLDKVSGPAPSLTEISGRKYPASVEAVFAQVLEREPDKRPETASAFVARLRDALRDGASMPPAGIRSRPPPADAPTSEVRLPRTRSGGTWIAAATVLLLGLGLGGWWAFGGASTPNVPATTVPTAVPTEPVLVIAPTIPPLPPASTVEAAPPPASVVATVSPARPRSGRTTVPATATPTATATATATPTPTPEPEAPAATVVTPPPPSEIPASEASSTDRSADLVRQAQSAMLHGQIANARQLYEEATQASPRMAAAWRGLGLASERLGLAPEARHAYERYLVLAPDAHDAPTVRDRLDHLAQ